VPTALIRLDRWRGWRSAPDQPIGRADGLAAALGADDDAEAAARRLLLYGVLPLWCAPSLADWAMHRRTRIEDTTGVRESAVHALMMAEAGVPVLAGLVAEVNPLVLTLMSGAALAHGATAVWDVSLATGERELRPIEQHIHSFLEVLPLTAAAFTAVLHWDGVRAALRGGRGPDDWRLLPKRHPLPAPYLAGIAGAVTLCVALPYAEEMVRCVRAARRRKARKHPGRRPAQATA
jgi:hypothetical protein